MIVALTLLLVLMAGSASAQFVDVAVPPINDLNHGSGVAWGDFDNDGDFDLYLANEEPNKLFRNEGGGVFIDFTDGVTGDPDDGQGVAWADYDNDGDLDLYLGIDGKKNKLFRNEGGGVFVNVATSPLDDTGVAAGTAWGDFNNDGRVDLYLSNEGANKLFRNEGGEVWVDVTGGLPLADTGIGPGSAWGDYDNDGDLDLYVANHDATNRLIRNDNSTFIDVTSPLLANGAGVGESVAWGDYDNDGDLDLYLGNGGPAPPPFGVNWLFRNEGDGTFTDATTSVIADPDDSDGVAWADYDNDGDLDIYIANGNTPNKLIRNDGGGVFADVTTAVLADAGDGEGLAWADYDNDGDLDLYLANQPRIITNPNRLYRNDLANGNHWIQIELEGGERPPGGLRVSGAVLSNRSAIGARVRVVVGELSMIREISGGTGSQSQPMLPAAFGLGTATTIDHIEVRWPSGIVWDTTGVAVDQRLKIHEGTPGVAAADHRQVERVSLSRAIPNPFSQRTTISYELRRAAHVSLTLFDLMGRPIRTLAVGPHEAGSYSVAWDGRRDDAAVAAPGLYFVRLSAGADTDHKKIMFLR